MFAAAAIHAFHVLLSSSDKRPLPLHGVCLFLLIFLYSKLHFYALLIVVVAVVVERTHERTHTYTRTQRHTKHTV